MKPPPELPNVIGPAVVDCVDGTGVRRQKTFKLKKLADDFSASSHVEIRDGLHVADGASVMVAEAGRGWISSAEAASLERATVDQYRQHVELHVVPFIGTTKLVRTCEAGNPGN